MTLQHRKALSAYPFKLTASDMDGTLLDENQQIDPVNVAAVDWLRSPQSMFVLASGRIAQQMVPYHRQLGLTEPIVACNGAYVFIPGGEVILAVGIPAAVAASIIKLASTKRVTALSYFEEGVSVTSKNHWNRDSERHVTEGTVEVTFCRSTRLRGRSPFKIVLSASKSRIDTLIACVTKRYGKKVDVLRLNDETIEFMPKGVNKKTGLQAVAKYFGIDAKDIAAFGDGNNDSFMLEWAGMGVAMHHGTQAAKTAACRVAPATDPAVNFAAAVTLAAQGAIEGETPCK